MSITIDSKYIRLEQLMAQRGRLIDELVEIEDQMGELAEKMKKIEDRVEAIDNEAEELMVVLQ